jgi:hypothetical protein
MARRPETKPDDLVVFQLITNTHCEECGEELGKGQCLFKKGEKGLCLECADMDHLVYLPSGDATLTRRAKKQSRLSAVVVRWSRARKRYERQGILVEEAALEQAEAECEADADTRALRRAAAQERTAELDAQYVQAFAAAIRQRYPLCPPGDEIKIAEHACRKYSGRVGRTSAAKQFEEKMIDLAVQAHVRHVHTKYDEYLMVGFDRDSARVAIRNDVAEVLQRWRGKSV